MESCRVQMARLRSLVWVGLLSVVFLWPAAGRGRRPKLKLYKNKAFKLQFVVPTGFQVSDQRTHPSILVALTHPCGAGVRVSVKMMASRITLMAFARKEVQVSKKIGFRMGKLQNATLAGLPARIVHGNHPKKPFGFTQYFVIRGRVGFVLTMTYPSAKKKALERSFQRVALSFKFTGKQNRDRK